METLDNIYALSEDELNEVIMLQESIATEEAMSVSEQNSNAERIRLENDLSAFCKEAWRILEPGVQLEWSWHYDYICEWLTLVYLRIITRLIINISPRTGKSLFVSVMFPAWVWAKQNTHNFACASYSAALATEHSVKRRVLIESEWYQSRWGDRVKMARDQNEKTKFKNTAMAQMIATSVGGTALGLGGDTMILDDGMNTKAAASDAEVLSTHIWFDGTWRTRLNNLATGAFIIMEQRTGERDVTGHCLDADATLEREGKPREWTHVTIPLVCENTPERYVFPKSGRVVIREPGDVLQPNRFPPSVVNSLQTRRLIYATQYQQHPSPLEGNMIKRKDIRYYGGRDPLTGVYDPVLPTKFDLILITADCSFKDLETSDMVAIGAIGIKGPDRCVLEITNAHLDLPATELEILRMQREWKASVVLVEDKANGSAVIKSIKRKIPGVVAIEPEGGKMSRVFATSGEFQAGNWYFPRTKSWTETAVEQLTKFPAAKYDDIVDLITQASIWLQRNTYVYGLLDLVKLRESEQMANAKKKVEAAKVPKAEQPQTTAPAATPEPEQPHEIGMAKIERSDEITKPDVDDGTLRCPTCTSTAIIRVGGGHRCNACGAQFSQAPPIGMSQGRNAAAMFRK